MAFHTKEHLEWFKQQKPLEPRAQDGKFRIRPQSNGLPSIVRIAVPKQIKVGPPKKHAENLSFNFDSIIQGATQESVYETCAAAAVTDVLNGYNGNIIAYGQVGSGKTFTMTGDIKPFVHSGLIPRCINRFFEEKESKPDAEITIHVSYLEIYNDVIYDLLMKNQTSSNLQAVEEKGLIEVKGLSRALCRTEADALKLFFEGEKRRSIATHPLSRASSRSHCTFTIYVERHIGKKSLPERTAARLNLVDLAGVERFRGNDPPDPLMREAMSINKSLTYLEQAVMELRKGQYHVSFRQSRLTALLRDAICGNGKTVLIACATPEDDYLDETISVLKFSQRLRELKTKAVANKVLDPIFAERKYERRIADLKKELALKDALCGREDIPYEELSDEMKDDLRMRVESFLTGNGEIENIPIETLNQVKEVFKIFKDVRSSLREEVDKAQDGDAEGSAEEILTPVNPDEGVGELDGQGFHVGEAPLDARPDTHDRMPSPVKKDVDGEVEAAMKTPPVKQEPDSDAKNASFMHFKRNTEDGQRFELILRDKNLELRLKRKFAHETCAHITEAKREISDLIKVLEEHGSKMRSEANQELAMDERREIKERLKIVKAEYRTAFEALKQVKREIESVQQEVRDCKRNLLECFYKWFNSGGAKK